MNTHTPQPIKIIVRRLARVAATAVISITAFSAFASAASAQTAQTARDVMVTEHVGSQDTGIDVVVNQRVTVRPTADKIWSGCWGWAWNGPEGTDPCGWGTLPLPSARAYGLLVSVNGQLRYVGAGASFPAPSTGRLFLKINDDTHNNGQGFFRANVETTTEVAKKVPRVIGMYEEDAGSQLRSAGFGWAASYRATHCGSEGKVVSQNPSGGTATFAVNVGIVVGAGPDGNPYTWC